MNSDREYLLALSTFISFGSSRISLLTDFFGSSKNAWEASKNELLSTGLSERMVENFLRHKKAFSPNKYLNTLRREGIKFLAPQDKDYPANLKNTLYPPQTLYVKGNLRELKNKAISIVGTRKITDYGKKVTRIFSSRLSSLGFTIVSGLARGVDTEAHKHALYKKGGTIAVLGSGLATIYPPENKGLADAIVKNGGAIVSEYPYFYPIRATNFAARNRIISGLSKAVVVVEGRRKSGTLLTASHAAEQGRTVFAVPGPIDSVMSEAPFFLIKNGASIATCVEDILEEIEE